MIRFLLWLAVKFGWHSVDEVLLKLKKMEIQTTELIVQTATKLSELQIESNVFLTNSSKHLEELQKRADTFITKSTVKLERMQERVLSTLEETTVKLQRLQLETSELLVEAARLQQLKVRALILISEVKRNKFTYQSKEWLIDTVCEQLSREYPNTIEAEIRLTVEVCCE